MDMPRNPARIPASEDETNLAKPKGTVKSIECPDMGITIHCVDFFKQPAFDNPLLKNYALQVKPNSSQKSNEAESSEGVPYQSWWKYGECPDGTIPIIVGCIPHYITRSPGSTDEESPSNPT